MQVKAVNALFTFSAASRPRHTVLYANLCDAHLRFSELQVDSAVVKSYGGNTNVVPVGGSVDTTFTFGKSESWV